MILNDSSVTEGLSWEQFVSQTSQQGSNTPYLLLYHKVGQEESEEEVPGGDKLARVLADNQRLLRDSQAPSVSFSTPGTNKRSNEDDEDRGAGGCQDNFGQMGGGRFVC